MVEYGVMSAFRPLSLVFALSIAMATAAAAQAAGTEPEKFAAEELERWLGAISEEPVGETFKVGTEFVDRPPEDRDVGRSRPSPARDVGRSQV